MSNKVVKKQVKKRIRRRKKPEHHERPSNTLRDQMINRLQNMPFGMFPQQYGNMNHLRNTNQALTQQVENSRIALQQYEQNNAKLTEQIKEIHKSIKDAKLKYEAAQDKYEEEKDNLSEKERIDRRTERYQNRLAIAKRKEAEYSADNDILLPLKNKLLSEEALVKSEELKNVKLQKKYTENEAYYKYLKAKQDVESIVAANKGMQDDIKSEEFQDPNKHLREVFQEKEKLKRENSYLQHVEDLGKQKLELQSSLASLPPSDLVDEANEKTKEAIQNQVKETFKLQDKYDKMKRDIDVLTENKKCLNALYMENNDKQIELEKLYGEFANLLNDGFYHSAKTNAIAKSIGEKNAQIWKTQRLINRMQKELENKEEAEILSAQTKELNKALDENDIELLNNEGKEKAKLEQITEQKKQQLKLIKLDEMLKFKKVLWNI